MTDFAGHAGAVTHDHVFLDGIGAHMLAFGDHAHVEWFEGNFEDYEADKIRRLGPDAVEPKWIRYKKFARSTCLPYISFAQANSDAMYNCTDSAEVRQRRRRKVLKDSWELIHADNRSVEQTLVRARRVPDLREALHFL